LFLLKNDPLMSVRLVGHRIKDDLKQQLDKIYRC